MNKRISINELNNAIMNCRSNARGADFIDFHYLEFASEEFMRIASFKKKPIYIKDFSHEEALAIVLDFFKSLGIDEWYNNARNILFSLNDHIGINIFNFEDVSDLEATDKNGIKMYSIGSSIESKVDNQAQHLIKSEEPKSLIRISKNSRYLDFYEVFQKDRITLEDIQTIVHEISHSFDLSNSTKNIEKRNMIVEITPFCFEKMLDVYLLEKNIVNSLIISSINTNRSQDIMHHARYVYTVINLFRIQKKDGKITKDGIETLLNEKNIHDTDYVRECLMDIINSDYNFDYHVKYMIAGLVSSMYLKQYKENKKEALNVLQEYCKCLKEGIVDDAVLKSIGFKQEKRSVVEAINEFEENFNGGR